LLSKLGRASLRIGVHSMCPACPRKSFNAGSPHPFNRSAPSPPHRRGLCIDRADLVTCDVPESGSDICASQNATTRRHCLPSPIEAVRQDPCADMSFEIVGCDDPSPPMSARYSCRKAARARCRQQEQTVQPHADRAPVLSGRPITFLEPYNQPSTPCTCKPSQLSTCKPSQ